MVGWEAYYEVSNLGRVRSCARVIVRANGWPYAVQERILRARVGEHDVRVALRRPGRNKTCRVHRLVLEAFVGPCPEGMEGCHNNGDPHDNRVENLRWDTHSANMADMIVHGTSPKGERHWRAQLTESQIRQIRQLAAAGKLSDAEIALRFQTTSRNIGAIVRGDAWTHVEGVTPRMASDRKYKRGAAAPNVRFTDADVRAIRTAWANGETQVSIASRYGTRQSVISGICRRETWKHIIDTEEAA